MSPKPTRVQGASDAPVGGTSTRRATPSQRWRWGVAVLALAIVTLGVLFARPPVVDATHIVRRDVSRLIVLTGRVRSPIRPQVAATTTGTVMRILAREGERVARGEVLVQLDDAQAKAEVAEARAALASVRGHAQAARERAATTLAQAERDLERTRGLVEAGALSARELEVATKAVDDARADVAGANARTGTDAFAEEERARAALEAAETRLADRRVRAPATAMVIARLVDPGDVVVPGQPLIELAFADRPEIVAYANEDNLADLRLGSDALVSADAFPAERFEAQVSWIAPAIDPTQGTVEVRLAVPEPPAYLIPDLTVSVNIVVARRENALVAPRGAVRDLDSPEPWVLVAIDGRAERRAVRIGIVGETHVEVVDGLVEGDRVLPASMEPGSRVRIRD